jgi:hypothetical protein
LFQIISLARKERERSEREREGARERERRSERKKRSEKERRLTLQIDMGGPVALDMLDDAFAAVV